MDLTSRPPLRCAEVEPANTRKVRVGVGLGVEGQLDDEALADAAQDLYERCRAVRCLRGVKALLLQPGAHVRLVQTGELRSEVGEDRPELRVAQARGPRVDTDLGAGAGTEPVQVLGDELRRLRQRVSCHDCRCVGRALGEHFGCDLTDDVDLVLEVHVERAGGKA